MAYANNILFSHAYLKKAEKSKVYIFFLFYFAISLLFGQAVSETVDYCSLCDNHTLCIYKGLGQKCSYTSTGGALSEYEKKIIVDTHNRLRVLVASGGETRGDPGPQPGATDMQVLEWDNELAKSAQAWADQCDFGHDVCREDPRFTVGQNVFLSEGGVPWEQAILSWYSEVEFLDNSIVDNFIFDAITGHYAQMVWGNTRYIGCGKRTYPQKSKRYYKRDTSNIDSLEPKLDHNVQEAQSDTVRQTRKIDYQQYNSGNQYGHYTKDYNNNEYQKQKNTYNESPQQSYYRQSYEEQIRRYNATIEQYYQKYESSLQNSDILKKQLEFYKNYLYQMEQLNSPYLSYEKKSQIYYELQEKHKLLEKIHERLLYHDQKYNEKIAKTKKLNPYIPKEYTFSTEHPIVAGQVYEYYVCNYGPTGLWPGARMYTKGWNRCSYHGGLCKDPLTVSYYPGLDRENDPVLKILYND